MNTRSVLLPCITALTLLGTSAQAAADGTSHNDGKDYGRPGAPSRLVGSWKVTIAPYVCATGEPVAVPAVDTYIAFGADGTLAEANSSPNFQPGQRSSGLGYWERTGRDTYRAVVQAFVQFTSVVTPPALPRYVRGTQRYDHGIEFADRDHWSSVVTVSFFDIGGTLVPPSGCANAAAVRME